MNKHLALVVTSFFLATLWGCGSNMDSGGDQTIGATPEELRASASFVGSTKCLSCHGDKENWGHTLHKTVLRKPGQFSKPQGKSAAFYADTINKGLDLLTGGKEIFYFNIGGTWHASQTNDAAQAVNLKFKASISKSGSSYTLTLTDLAGTSGVKTYPVLLTYGGEANYKQRYVVTIGNSKYISPLQYNDKGVDSDPATFSTSDSLWVPYNAQDWYTAASNTLKVPALAKAFDGNCAGCHFTGYSVNKNSVTGEEMADAVNDPNGALDFDGDGALDEINVGCEACHGAGSVHASTSNPAYIVNPANLTPEKANMVCGQCHIRGVTKDDFSALTARAKLEFPAKINADGQLQKFRPGDDINDYYEWISTAGQYWGNLVPGGGFVASKQHHQQYIDMLQGDHAAITCAACHESHDNADPSRVQVRTSRTVNGVNIVTATDDNTLCLSCHAGNGIFASVTIADVAKVRINGPSAALAAAVSAHTGHTYDPTNSGASRCVDCHMPYTAKTALNYDIRAHSFKTIKPKLSLSTAATKDVPNSCGSCHVKGLSETNDAWATRLQGYFDYLFGTLAVLPTVGVNEYAGTPVCTTCHQAQSADFLISGHGFKLTKVVDRKKPDVFPSFVPKLPEIGIGLVGLKAVNNTLGVPASYADASYVIGGYGWKARWIDKNGYTFTGTDAQWNMVQNGLMPDFYTMGVFGSYNTANINQKYNFNCFMCHTTGNKVGTVAGKTGTFAENLSPAFVGFEGDSFVMPGIQCEACHGGGLLHAQNPYDNATTGLITVTASARSRADLLADNAYGKAVACSECHTRDGEREIKFASGVVDTTNSFKTKFTLRTGIDREQGGLIVASNNLIQHHEQNEELLGIDPVGLVNGDPATAVAKGAHRDLHCATCHNPHKTTKYQDVAPSGNSIHTVCLDCHGAGGVKPVVMPAASAMKSFDCKVCHMPRLVKSAVEMAASGNRPKQGDIRAHILKIDLTKTIADQFSGGYARPFITQDYACRTCHNTVAGSTFDLGLIPGFSLNSYRFHQ